MGTYCCFVSGQESALVNSLSGRTQKTRIPGATIRTRGPSAYPTLVQNVETLAHLALIFRHGAGWYRQAGTAADPGSTLVTLSGAVASSGVYEIEHGAALADLLDSAGQTEELAAVLIGGYFGSWLPARHPVNSGFPRPSSPSTASGRVPARLSPLAAPSVRWLRPPVSPRISPARLPASADRASTVSPPSPPRRGRSRADRTARSESGIWNAGAARWRPWRLPVPRRRDPIRRQRAAGFRRRLRGSPPSRPLRGLPGASGPSHPASRWRSGAMRIALNPIRCEAHGMCAELLPERVTLNERGYPILDGSPLPPHLVAHARRAADARPRLRSSEPEDR